MACRLARQAESRPYCMLATATMAHINRHFLFAHSEFSRRWGVSESVAICCPQSVRLVRLMRAEIQLQIKEMLHKSHKSGCSTLLINQLAPKIAASLKVGWLLFMMYPRPQDGLVDADTMRGSKSPDMGPRNNSLKNSLLCAYPAWYTSICTVTVLTLSPRSGIEIQPRI